jgi:cytoskeletal protein RodZ
MDIGGELRTARLARALSIADIAHATKISPRILHAIEAGAFDTIPRGPFMRGYLTAYARQVGLDGEELIRSYRAEFDVAAPPPFIDRAVLTPDGPIDRGSASILSLGSQSERLQVALIALIVAAVVYLGTQHQPTSASQAGAPLAEKSQAVSPPPSGAAPAQKDGAVKRADVSVGTSGAVGTKAVPLTIDLRATGPCWVEATADGARVFMRLMDAGDRQTIAANGRVTMRVGDPSTFAFTINGAAGRSLGLPRRPVTVRIDAESAAQFVAP